MRLKTLIITAFLVFLLIPIQAQAKIAMIGPFNALTGGAAGALDRVECEDIKGDNSDRAIATGDIAITVDTGMLYLHQYDSTGEDAESSPDIIVPDDRADCDGKGQWNLITGVDISDFTNLAVDANELTLTGDSLGLADHNTARTALGLAIGTDVQAQDADLTNIAGADTWMVYYKNGSAVLTDLACGAAGTFFKFNGASSAPTATAVTDTVITTTDVTTNNASTSKHGFRAKLTNVAYSYLDETGTVRAGATVPAAPGSDKLLFWDHSALAFVFPTLTGLSITGTVVAVIYEDAAGINTGTQTAEALTADALAGSNLGSKEAAWTIIDSDTVTAVANGKQAFAVPATMVGMNLVDVTASVHDLNSASGGTTTVVLRRVRGNTAQDMTSTGVTIGYGQYTASDETVDAGYDDLAEGDKIYVDVDAVTTGAAQKGLSVTATFRLP